MELPAPAKLPISPPAEKLAGMSNLPGGAEELTEPQAATVVEYSSSGPLVGDVRCAHMRTKRPPLPAMSVELDPGFGDQVSPGCDGTGQIGPAETFARPLLVTERSP